MAMVEKTFTVVTQTWVNEGSTAVNIDYIRTWRELYYQIAAAGIGWTLEVTTDTLNGKNGGTFAGKMHHTATGLWYTCYASSSSSSTSTNSGGTYNNRLIYNAAGKSCGRYVWLCLPLYFNNAAGSQNTYFIDEINDGVFQDCRPSQGQSNCMWRVARGELIDGTSEGYCSGSSTGNGIGGNSSSISSIISDLYTYSDLADSTQGVSFSGLSGSVMSGAQLYIGRCYGIRSSQTNGITMTWGGKKIWRTSYTLVPKATYVIDNKRYTALNENILLEE